MAALFQSVIWPAVAGNVAWAFFTVLIQEWAQGGAYSWPRLCLLGALAIYLCLDWMHTESIKAELRPWYWVGDVFLATAIAAVAIAAQASVGDGRLLLVGVFAASAGAQLCGAWTRRGVHPYRDGQWMHRLAWLVLNGAAASIAILGGSGKEWGWNLAGAATLVIVCWGLAKPGNVHSLRWLRD